jgi:hypothetical protein
MVPRGITVVQLAKAPLGIGMLTPANGPAAGGGSITLRGSGLVSSPTVSIGGKNAVTTFKGANTLSFVVPMLPSGAQQVQLKNPDGETVPLDAAFTANGIALPAQLNFSRHPFIQFLYIHSASCAKGTVQWQ